MEIKKVAPGDLDILNDLLAKHIDREDPLPTSAHLQKMLKDNRTYLFVARSENRVAGYALAYRFPSLYASANMAYLYDIDVVPDCRKKGIGRRLIETLLEQLKADGVTEVWLGTAIDNAPAQRLFAATGGVRSGETFYDFTFKL